MKQPTAKVEKCWKLVRKDRGRLRSVIASGKVGVTYKPGVWVEGRAGCLFAFRTLTDARNFAHDESGCRDLFGDGDLAVYAAEGLGRDGFPYCGMGWYNGIADIRAAWMKTSRFSVNFPRGSVTYKRIRLLKQVWPKPGKGEGK